MAGWAGHYWIPCFGDGQNSKNPGWVELTWSLVPVGNMQLSKVGLPLAFLIFLSAECRLSGAGAIVTSNSCTFPADLARWEVNWQEAPIAAPCQLTEGSYHSQSSSCLVCLLAEMYRRRRKIYRISEAHTLPSLLAPPWCWCHTLIWVGPHGAACSMPALHPFT